MKKRCFNVASHFLMMAVLLIGMMVIVPENAQAATQQVKFIDGYSKKPTTDQMINGMVNWYRIKLPENWKYTDKNVTIKVSNKSVAYLEYEKSEPDGFYLCANYDEPYNTYKPVTVTATKTDAAGNKKVATLKVHRYAVSCVPKKKTVYAGTTFKLPYKTITDGKSGVKTQFASDNASVASISQTGMVTAKKAGKTYLMVWNEGGRAELELTVKALPAMSRTTASLNIGASTKLTLKNLPKGTAVTWKSSNTKIATVAGGMVKQRRLEKQRSQPPISWEARPDRRNVLSQSISRSCPGKGNHVTSYFFDLKDNRHVAGCKMGNDKQKSGHCKKWKGHGGRTWQL
ncbi:MAG: Ig-like domain-containing protein [Lachnospiraceae bacterium]